MIEQVARAIAKADGARFEDDPERFRKLALAALKPIGADAVLQRQDSIWL